MKHVTRNQLRTFLSVVQSGSMNGAAQKLNLTTPAVSIQIKQLEEQTGVPLLERARSGVSLTEAGEIVLATVKRIETSLHDCEDELNALKGLSSGHAYVGGVSTAKYFAPHAFAAFSKLHPTIDMKLSIGNRQQTIANLANYEIDLAIMGRPPRDFEVEYEPIGSHPHVIIALPDHPLAGIDQISPKAIANEIFLTREKGSGTRSLTLSFFEKNSMNPAIGMEIDSNETIKQAVIAGLGIAFISAHTIANEIRDGRLIILDVKGLPLMREWYVVRRSDKRLLPATRELWEFMKTNAHSFLPQINGDTS